MDWWHIIGGILLGWSVPWALLRISDGMFLLNQIFRVIFWGSFLIAYEIVELNLIYCFVLAHIPGGIIWACYDSWVGEDDEPREIEDPFQYGEPIESTQTLVSLIVLPNDETLTPQVG